jgi:hypothetical protein
MIIKKKLIGQKNFVFVTTCLLILSAIIILPNIILKINLKDNYSPVIFNNKFENSSKIRNLDEMQYYSYIHEISESNKLLLNDPHIYENRNQPSMLFSQAVPYIIMGKIKMAIPDNFYFTITILFFFSFILFMVIYFLVYLLTKNDMLSLLSVPLISNPDIFAKPNPLKIIHEIFFYRDGYFFIGSPIQVRNIIDLLFMFLFIYFFIKGYSNEKHEKKKSSFYYLLIASIFLGLEFYTYFPYWTFIIGGIFILFIFNLFESDFDKNKKIIQTGIISFILFIPFIYYYLKWRATPGYIDYTFRVGINNPIIDYIYTPFFILILILFYLTYKITKETLSNFDKNNYFLLVSLIIGGAIILTNQHIITKHTIYSNYWASTGFYFVLIIGFVSINYILKKFKIDYPKLFIILFILIISGITFSQVRNVYKLEKYYNFEPKFKDSIDFLNKNSFPNEVVVSTSFRNNYMINAFTNLKTLTTFSAATTSTNVDLINRYYTAFHLFNVSAEQFSDWININPKLPESGNNILFDHTFTYKYGEIPNDIKKNLSQNYINFNLNLNKYKIDYIYISPIEKKISSIDYSLLNNLGFIKIYDKNEVEIYKKK